MSAWSADHENIAQKDRNLQIDVFDGHRGGTGSLYSKRTQPRSTSHELSLLRPIAEHNIILDGPR